MQIIDRRNLLGGLTGAAGVTVAAAASHAGARQKTAAEPAGAVHPKLLAKARDNADVLQRAIDKASQRGVPVLLPAGTFRISSVVLANATKLIGFDGATRLKAVGAGAVLSGKGCADVTVSGLAIDCRAKAQTGIHLQAAQRVSLEKIVISGALQRGISLEGCSGAIQDCRISACGDAGLFCVDSGGLRVAYNTVQDCGNNGIQIWRSKRGEDGSIVTGNHIENIAAASGGSGQNGNGINMFRADGVVVSNNRITDCAYSAVRGNASSNLQITSNNCARLGEVALYAEFGFEGTVIASNIVDTAAAGISVTNFADGGRLAVVQGNLVRNLFRREHEPVDKRGEGIFVEADAAVTGNTVENAATAGIAIGWGEHMRDVAVTGNVVRQSRVGIALTKAEAAGACLISNNLVSGARDGAIRAVDYDTPTGADLASEATRTSRVAITDNLAV